MFDLETEMKLASSDVEKMKALTPELKLEKEEGFDVPELDMYRSCYNLRAKVQRRVKKITELRELHRAASTEKRREELVDAVRDIEYEIIVLCFRIHKGYMKFMNEVG